MSVAQFPSPYPDESLGSILARYQLRTGRRGFYEVRQDLGPVFTDATRAHQVQYHGLQPLVEAIGYAIPLDTLLWEHTMLPYYAPSLDAPWLEKALKSAIDPHGKSGVPQLQGPVQRTSAAFCPVCLLADYQRYGEPYWHRLHQLPGLRTCPIHEETLQTYCPTCNIEIPSRHALWIRCPNDHPLGRSVPASPRVAHWQRRLAEGSAELLRDGKVLRLEVMTEWYRTLLRDAGFVHDGRLDSIGLQEEIHKSLGLQEPVLDTKLYNWTANLLPENSRWPQRLVHPARHILVMQYLCNSVEAFVAFGLKRMD